MSIRFKLTLLLVTLFTFAIGNTVFTFLLENYVEEKLNWVIHTHEVLNESKNLLSSMTDAETGQRGYLLTGDPDYLEPYLKGLSSAEESFKRLTRLTSDNPEQIKRLKTIHGAMGKKFEELKLTIDLRKHENAENAEKAIDVVKRNNGKQIMDEIRLDIIAFENTEHLLLETRKGDFRESRAQITTLMALEILFFLFLGIITMIFIRNKLFSPISMLLLNTAKMERGEQQNIQDILPKDEMGYLLSRFYQMSEKVYANTAALSHEATHDHLTGLLNRSEINKTIRDSIVSTSASNKKMAVCFIDLNGFKQLNDNLGHDAGDAVLIETAKRLKGMLRTDDSLFRLGGDEFVLILNDIAETSHLNTIAGHILEKFTSPLMFNGIPIEISLSIGIALSPDDSKNSEEILKFSDIAMYTAKREKKHNYTFFNKTMLKRESDI
ncbi:MAG: diguanylate cyclase [Porticoccaceae bacterium]|nr:diguanylate cyclase [Porticoccaceae bacterium]